MVQANVYVETAAQLQAAIDAIGAGDGIIQMGGGTITLTANIDVDGGGSYIIQGMGNKTIIDCDGNRRINITVAESCVFRDFKIDASDVAVEIGILRLAEGSSNKILIENVTISGNGTNGYGVEVVSNNCTVRNCFIDNMKWGIYCYSNYNYIYNNNCQSNSDGIRIGADYNIITKNICYLNSDIGIYANSGDYCIFNDNLCYNNTSDGIQLVSSSNVTLNGNNCVENTLHGIYLVSANNNSITGNNCNANNLNDAADGGGIWLNDTSDNNSINGNVCNGNVNGGAGDAFGINIANANCDENTLMGNTALNNDTNLQDLGTGTLKQTAAADPYNNI